MVYFSTLITGLQELAAELIKKEDPKVTILKLAEGFIVYDSKLPVERITTLPFLNNSYVQLHYRPNQKLEEFLTVVSADSSLDAKVQAILKGKRTILRLRISDKNISVSVNRFIVEKIEARLLRLRNVTINRNAADTELQLLRRDDGACYAGLQLSKPGEKQELEKGELSPELCYLLCALSEPNKSDVFLDPFCGTGAIPLKRARSFDYKRIIALDTDISKITYKISTSKKPRDFDVIEGNAKKLEQIGNESITKIVTDPPWGIYEKMEGIGRLYFDFLQEASRVLATNGVLILLTAQKDLMNEFLTKDFKQIFESEQIFDILVSGKKARVYKLRKR